MFTTRLSHLLIAVVIAVGGVLVGQPSQARAASMCTTYADNPYRVYISGAHRIHASGGIHCNNDYSWDNVYVQVWLDYWNGSKWVFWTSTNRRTYDRNYTSAGLFSDPCTHTGARIYRVWAYGTGTRTNGYHYTDSDYSSNVTISCP